MVVNYFENQLTPHNEKFRAFINIGIFNACHAILRRQ